MEGERLSSSQNIKETAELIQIKRSFSVEEAAGTNDADDPYSTICCRKTQTYSEEIEGKAGKIPPVLIYSTWLKAPESATHSHAQGTGRWVYISSFC